MVLEDDAEPATPNTIKDIVYLVIPQVMKQRVDVMFSKLFVSFGYQGFLVDFETTIELPAFLLLISCLVYGLLIAMESLVDIRKFHLPISSSESKLSNKMIVTIVISVMSLLLILALNRQSTLLALKTFLVPYRISNAPVSSTTATLYPENKLTELMPLMDNLSLIHI